MGSKLKYNSEEGHGWDITPTTSTLTENKIISLNHYINLQPLCGKINSDGKRDKMDF